MICPHCSQTMSDAPDLAGQAVACPHCSRQFLAPSPIDPAITTPRRSFREAARTRFQPARSILDIFDVSFTRYVTPIVVKVTWILWLIAGVAYFAEITRAAYNDLMFVQKIQSSTSIVNDEAPAQGWKLQLSRNSTDPASFIILKRYVLYAFGFVTLLLWIRVALESVIVVFNMAKSLEVIERQGVP